MLLVIQLVVHVWMELQPDALLVLQDSFYLMEISVLIHVALGSIKILLITLVHNVQSIVPIVFPPLYAHLVELDCHYKGLLVNRLVTPSTSAIMAFVLLVPTDPNHVHLLL